jgi:uncharacterized membrane protein YtjA (UPF0391 family)
MTEGFCHEQRPSVAEIPDQEPNIMSLLKWALIFAVIALIAGIFGFTGIAGASADIARILFYLFVVIFVVLLLLGMFAFRSIAGP